MHYQLNSQRIFTAYLLCLFMVENLNLGLSGDFGKLESKMRFS